MFFGPDNPATLAHVVAVVVLAAWLIALPFRSRRFARRLEIALAQLRAAEAELQGVFSAMTDVVLVLSREGQYLKVPSTNARGLYAPSSEMVGRNVRDVLPLQDAEKGFEAINKAIESGEPVSYDYSIEFPDGTRWFSACVTRLNDDAVVWVARDVTERRTLEAQLLQVQKMDSVGMLAGGVAHDFNNILTAIGAHTTFLLESLDADDPRHEDARQIKLGADRAASLTRQLLAFSRKQMLKPVVLDLNTIVAQIHEMLRRIVGEDIRIVPTLAHDLAPVLADPTQIQQVLLNLVVNARDAMPRGGVLAIETRNVNIDAAQAAVRPGFVAGRYVRLAVTDDGVGMSEEVQARIFEPFFTTKDMGRGTGLGLSTVYGIVKQSSGYIYVESAPNRGTTFEVFLPRVGRRRTDDAGEEEIDELPRASETILLVEDEPSVRAVASRVLNRQGYRVLQAVDGREAIQIASRHAGHIDLVLTDAVMPGMGGADVAREIRAARPSVKVLFMSGYTEDEIIRRQILVEPTAFLEKPFTASALTNAVWVALGPSVADRSRQHVGRKDYSGRR
jgi:two-component system cell cycle sensor histidine kinase/response regulator CckA